MEYLIVGTGRCGTGFVKHLLTINGINCGHETVFSLPHSKEEYLQNLKTIAIRAESSWLVVPFLNDILKVEPGIKLLHITRHPVKVIKSLLDLNITATPIYIQAIAPYVTGATDIDRYVSFYITWHNFLEQYDRVILDIDDFDYSKFGKFIGKTATRSDNVVNKKDNGKPILHAVDDVLNGIKESCYYDELCVLCEKYGFLLSEKNDDKMEE